MRTTELTRCEQGFSLLEMMIALVILTVALLALATSSTMAIRTNHQNEIRNAAIRVASQRIAAFSSQAFDEITYGNTVENIDIVLRSGGSRGFTIDLEVDQVSLDLARINLEVQYELQGINYNHNTVTFIGREK